MSVPCSVTEFTGVATTPESDNTLDEWLVLGTSSPGQTEHIRIGAALRFTMMCSVSPEQEGSGLSHKANKEVQMRVGAKHGAGETSAHNPSRSLQRTSLSLRQVCLTPVPHVTNIDFAREWSRTNSIPATRASLCLSTRRKWWAHRPRGSFADPRGVMSRRRPGYRHFDKVPASMTTRHPFHKQHGTPLQRDTLSS